MRKLLASVFMIFLASATMAQSYECLFADIGEGAVEQKVLLTEGDSTFTFTAQGEIVNMDFVNRLEASIPGYDQILDIDFGPSTYIYTIDGEAVIFRKCRATKSVGTVAEADTKKDGKPE